MALSDNLIYYWDLNETSGSRTDEVSSLVLSDNNTVTYQTGKISNGATFTSANSEYLMNDNGYSDSGGDISLSFWIYLTASTANDDGIYTIKSAASNANSITAVMANIAGTNILFAFWNSAGNDYSRVYITAPSTGSWHHVVVVMDVSQAASGFTIYVDGSAVSDTHYNTNSSTHGAITGGDVTLGAQGNGQAGTFFDGGLDEFGIWNRLLTSDEVSQLYNSGNGLAYADIIGGGGGGAHINIQKMKGIRVF
jgi:hypothetical protein